MFEDKTLLITGGTGSFGRAVLEKYLHTDIDEIRIFSRDEKKQFDMRKEFSHPKFKFYIGDVRDKDSLKSAMSGVDYVFHAAALKQVPSCEFYPIEAMKTNSIGAVNVIDTAVEEKVEKIIFLSTDKAVYPINAMGMTKALMERIVVAKSRSLKQPVLCCTRYGNVMATRGSVIPLFINQIKNKESLTITDPEMTRFMMHLNDSVDLVLFAFCAGNSGDIFVKKSSACTLLDLAKALKELFESKSEIKIIGTRHGEKKHEVLINREEMVRVTDILDYYRIEDDVRDLNYDKYYTSGSEERYQEYTSENTQRLNLDELKKLLLTLNCVKSQIC